MNAKTWSLSEFPVGEFHFAHMIEHFDRIRTFLIEYNVAYERLSSELLWVNVSCSVSTFFCWFFFSGKITCSNVVIFNILPSIPFLSKVWIYVYFLTRMPQASETECHFVLAQNYYEWCVPDVKSTFSSI